MTTTLVDIYGIPSDCSIFAAVQSIEFLNVFSVDLEIKDIDIGTYTVRVLRLGKRDETVSAVRYHRVVSGG